MKYTLLTLLVLMGCTEPKKVVAYKIKVDTSYVNVSDDGTVCTSNVEPVKDVVMNCYWHAAQ
jgi:hypothetical protein